MKVIKYLTINALMFAFMATMVGCYRDNKHKQGVLVKQDTKLKHDTSDSANKIKKLLAGDTVIAFIKDTLVKLPFGFKAKIILSGTQWINIMQLFHNGKKINLGAHDSSAYILDDKLYPIVNKIDTNTFELFFEQDDRPNKNTIRFFRIENDIVTSIKVLPTFFSKPSDLDGDGILEEAGSIDYSEEFGEKGKLYRTIDPILYYKLTNQGIKLDSAMTIERNTYIYGKFYGFQFDGKTGVDVRLVCNARWEKEYKRIVANAK
jgi:hypothetical protein